MYSHRHMNLKICTVLQCIRREDQEILLYPSLFSAEGGAGKKEKIKSFFLVLPSLSVRLRLVDTTSLKEDLLHRVCLDKPKKKQRQKLARIS